MKIINSLVYTPEFSFVEKDVYIDGARFSSDERSKSSESDSQVFDATGLYAIPGLIDIHFHGCMGNDFSDADADGLFEMAMYQAQNGVTSICPASMTVPKEQLFSIMKNVRTYISSTYSASIATEEMQTAITDSTKTQNLEISKRTTSETNPHNNVKVSTLVGINMEGPFLSPSKAGAQNPAHMIPADVELFRELQEASGNLIKLLSVAPEEPGAIACIDELRGEVVCSIAHTTAGYDISRKAMKLGALHVTHLYNAMPPLSHREPGVVGAAFDTKGCKVELITDGVHIHPSVVRATFQLFGDEHVVLVSDSMRATGLGEGVYTLGGQSVLVQGSKATLVHGDNIAGSVTNLMDCVRIAVKEMGIPIESAIRAATINAAKSIGIDAQYGSIEAGKFADLILLDKNLKIVQVFIKGQPVLSLEG